MKKLIGKTKLSAYYLDEACIKLLKSIPSFKKSEYVRDSIKANKGNIKNYK